jgi:hypothetical protein
MPMRQRAAVSSATSLSGRGAALSTQRARRGGAVACGCADAGASTSVFHDAHTGHCPNQRVDSPPHAVQ